MPTFLTTSKMSPALAARVEASVTGRRRAVRKPSGARYGRALARVLVPALILLAVAYVVAGRRRAHASFEQDRAKLLEELDRRTAPWTADDRAFLSRAQTLLASFARSQEADVVEEELRTEDGLRTVLASPAVYVRGAAGDLTRPEALADAAAASRKDAFLVCLLDPPAPRTEKALHGRVRTAYANGTAVEQRTANVRRLHEVHLALPLLSSAWPERVRAATEPPELVRLRRELDKAPLEAALKATRASVLIVVVDEPDQGSGPTELDGERPHDVRVGMFDLTSSKLLLRMRKHVDPSWITPATRAEHASGLDGCALALDVREATSAPKAAPPRRSAR